MGSDSTVGQPGWSGRGADGVSPSLDRTLQVQQERPSSSPRKVGLCRTPVERAEPAVRSVGDTPTILHVTSAASLWDEKAKSVRYGAHYSAGHRAQERSHSL